MGFYLKDESYYDVYSTFLYTGIWTHFVHPDDVFNIKNSNEKQKKKYAYELRNENGLFWKKKKKSLFKSFDEFLVNYKKIHPLSQFYTAKVAGPKVIDWRGSNFEHSIANNTYSVTETTNLFQKTGNSWFVYFDELNTVNEQELKNQSDAFNVNPFFGGKLVNVAAKNSLSFTMQNLETQENIIIQAVNDYDAFTKERFKYISGTTVELSQEDFQKKIEEDKQKLLEQILSQPEINPEIWNKYAYYMSWEDKGDQVWQLLDDHCQKYPSQNNINYSSELSKILGFSSDKLHHKWIKLQYKWNQEKLPVLKEYLSIIFNSGDIEEIGMVIQKIYQLEPTCENEHDYLNHLLVYKKDKAFEYLDKVNPSTANYSSPLVSDICWTYVNVKEDYQSAINWADYSDLIGVDTKLFLDV